MAENRNERLAFDFHEMLKIQDRPYLSWIATKGDLPYIEEYLLSVRLRTYALSARSGAYTVGAIRRCTIKVTLWGSYPDVAPHITMLDLPPVFHPDWYSKGAYSPAVKWDPEMSLKDYILRMLDALRYEPSLIGTDTPANFKALDWYMKHRDDTSLFPSDTVELTENDPQQITAAEKAMTEFEEVVDAKTVR